MVARIHNPPVVFFSRWQLEGVGVEGEGRRRVGGLGDASSVRLEYRWTFSLKFFFFYQHPLQLTV